MPDSIKISQLTLLPRGNLSPGDQLVINDADSSNNQIVTYHTTLGGLLEFITSQQLTFSGDAEFSGDVTFSGNLELKGPISLTNTLTITSPGQIKGLTLGGLDDVEVGAKNDNDALFWDANVGSGGAWVPRAVPNANEYYDKTEVDNKIQQNVVFSTTEPTNPELGMFWLKTDQKLLYIYDGSGFVSARPDGLLIGDGLSTSGYVAPPVSTIPTATYSTGTPGQFTADDDYIYFCVAPNTWIKTVIVPFDEDTQVLEIE